MPKRKAQVRREERAARRRERKAGAYIKPGDPEFRDLSTQLGVQGLGLKDVPGDGNCLFRALAEQLDDRHSNLRQKAVEHIRSHSADYAPFLDEDTSFESYVDELSKDGTFAGNDAIVAVSKCYSVNVVIHQLGEARWEVRPHTPTHKTLHIAYLRGEHYCSVSSLRPGQALPQVEARLPDTAHPTAAKLGRSEGRSKSGVQHLLEATGCQDRVLAERCYWENGGELDLAIVELLQLMALTEGAGDVQVLGREDARPSNKATSLPASTAIAGSSSPPTGKRQTPKSHLSNRERKEVAKAARKQASKEARRKGKQEDTRTADSDPVGATAI